MMRYGGLVGRAASTAPPDPVPAIRDVAHRWRGEAVGYGMTAWNADTRTVLYVCGDWTDPDPIRVDMLAIPGVDGFDHEAESLPGGWADAQIVYPDDPPLWVLPNALADLVTLASQPLMI